MMSASSSAVGISSSTASVRSLGSRKRVHHFVPPSLGAVMSVVSLAADIVVILPGAVSENGRPWASIRWHAWRALAQHAAQATFHLVGALLGSRLAGEHAVDRGADDLANLVVARRHGA